MDRNVKNKAKSQTASDKSPWISPKVWDVMVDKTQGGAEPAQSEFVTGNYVSPDLMTAAPS